LAGATGPQIAITQGDGKNRRVTQRGPFTAGARWQRVQRV